MFLFSGSPSSHHVSILQRSVGFVDSLPCFQSLGVGAKNAEAEANEMLESLDLFINSPQEVGMIRVKSSQKTNALFEFNTGSMYDIVIYIYIIYFMYVFSFG